MSDTTATPASDAATTASAAPPAAEAPESGASGSAVAASDAPDAAEATAEETAAAQRRARRGSRVAGAISLPLMTAGIIGLAVPLGVWYLSTVIRTIVVVIANAANGGKAAEDANSTLGAVDPGALSGFTLVFAIVGAAFLIGGVLVSIFVLRSHGVARPLMVTGFGAAVGLIVATILSATIGALAGLIFGTSQTVGQVLATAALGLALTVIGSVAVTVGAGALVWPWMARLFRG